MNIVGCHIGGGWGSTPSTSQGQTLTVHRNILAEVSRFAVAPTIFAAQ